MSSLKRKAQTEPTNTAKKAKAVGGSITSFFSSSPASSSFLSTTSFNKAKWVASLTAEQKQLLQLEISSLHESWLAHLKDEITSPQFLDLKRFLERETRENKKWFPPKEDVYSWSRHTPLQKVKIVIVGQDPYHNVNQAHGLAFSVHPPTPAPPSLKNMFLALKKDYPTFEAPARKGGLLTPWAEKGVLMLNACLTVRAHEANSHANRGWEKFTQKVIDLVAAKRTRGVVFMAWGSPAGKRVAKIDQHRNLILRAVHPSPLSAHKGFFDCGHFREANDWLVTRYGEGSEVDWSLGGPPAPLPSGQQKKASPIPNPAPPATPKAEKGAALEVKANTNEVDGTAKAKVPKDDEETEDKAENLKKQTPVKKEIQKLETLKKTASLRAKDDFNEPDEDEEAALLEIAEAAERGG
ncbi:uracil-DNA glycosylase [Zalerion maritima]|uniref:Uracil-DNA glycosylase n=1 Tax=Zalerion maritima TaxID=339359 RepID=A0AAD5RSX1_9PEZI|nr:uracil-DNA glycosylase [Zalerion maritima]